MKKLFFIILVYPLVLFSQHQLPDAISGIHYEFEGYIEEYSTLGWSPINYPNWVEQFFTVNADSGYIAFISGTPMEDDIGENQFIVGGALVNGIATSNLILNVLPNIPGCTNPIAENFNPDATVDDGSCWNYCEIMGDINNDGFVNVLDILLMICIPFMDCNPVECEINMDVNQDGAVNVLDIVMIVNMILGE